MREGGGDGYRRGMTSLASAGPPWQDRETDSPNDPLPLSGHFDHLIVGAGLTGIATALLLARAGRVVGVLDARHPGAGTTGRSTAKITVLQGTKLSTLMHRQSREVAASYLSANQEGAAWIRRFCEDHGVAWQSRPSVTYAASPAEVPAVRAEYDAATALGLPVTAEPVLDVPFPAHAAVRLPDQMQLDPLELLHALVVQLRAHGGTVHHDRRVVEVRRGRPTEVRLADDTRLTAAHVVVATGTPVVDRGLHFARLRAYRSYVVALRDASVAPGMYVSAGAPSHSVRDVPGDPSLLLVGGYGHETGRVESEQERLDALRTWACEAFPDGRVTHAWSAQDYGAFDGVPSVGRLPGPGDIHVATGYDGWGMANSVAAAHTIAAETLGGVAPGLRSRPLAPAALGELAAINLSVVREMACHPLAPRCPHLGGPLAWNDAEQTWDCRLHGSRFAATGEVLEGPATHGLRFGKPRAGTARLRTPTLEEES